MKLIDWLVTLGVPKDDSLEAGLSGDVDEIPDAEKYQLAPEVQDIDDDD